MRDQMNEVLLTFASKLLSLSSEKNLAAFDTASKRSSFVCSRGMSLSCERKGVDGTHLGPCCIVKGQACAIDTPVVLEVIVS